MCCQFSPDCSLATLPPHRLDQLSILPSQVLSRRGAVSPHTILNYVVPSRADDVVSSPGRVVVSLGGIRNH
jgi:hypothetical protein